MPPMGVVRAGLETRPYGGAGSARARHVTRHAGSDRFGSVRYGGTLHAKCKNCVVWSLRAA